MSIFSKHPQFTPPSPAIEQRIDAILARLSLEDKLDLIGGINEGTKAKPHAGLPALRFADGPLGVHWWCKSSTAYPATICLAASFDRAAAYRAGAAIGRDGRARGVHILLAPGVNIYRAAVCGRNFEYFGEDPCLAAHMVTDWIRGCQDQGVATTVKHFAVNFHEYDRHNVSSDVDERTLREVYLPAFEAAIRDAGSGALMTGYNLVNGVHCSEHAHLIRTILKGEWGFDGVVMSDWASTYDGVAAANAGLDLEMPTGAHMNAAQLLPATFEKCLEDRSSFACYHDHDKDKRVALTDGIFGGYRHVDKTGIAPQFPFGFGLSYTTFAFENLRVSVKTVKAGQPVTVSCDVVNTGTRAGAEVVQLYVRDVRCSVPRPIKELKGFAKVQLAPGARDTVHIELDDRAFRFWHPDHGWTIEPGAFELLLGASAQDIRLTARIKYAGTGR